MATKRESIRNLPADVSAILTTDPFLTSVRIRKVSPVPGGVAHRVYAIHSEAEKYFLKIRGDHFASIPSIACDPGDIAHEHKALTMFGNVAPARFPRVLSFNNVAHYLVLSDVIKDGEKLDVAFKRGTVPDNIFTIYGDTLAELRRATHESTEPVRSGGDNDYYQRVLGHRLGYRNHPVLNTAIDGLTALPHRQLILADAAPKNMGIQHKRNLLTLYDLETAHQGNPEFEYAYGAAHTLLHSLPRRDHMHNAINQYTKGYGEAPYNAQLIFRLVLGLMLYRLRSIIPYPIALRSRSRQKLVTMIESRLPRITGKESWHDIVDQMMGL